MYAFILKKNNILKIETLQICTFALDLPDANCYLFVLHNISKLLFIESILHI